jgi:hypothetical protein
MAHDLLEEACHLVHKARAEGEAAGKKRALQLLTLYVAGARVRPMLGLTPEQSLAAWSEVAKLRDKLAVDLA